MEDLIEMQHWPQNGQMINVQAYKQDGTLYRQWNGVKVIEVSPEVIVTFMYKTKVVEKSGQHWIVREPIIWFFPIDDWYNTTALIRKGGIYFYTNLASKPLFEDNTMKFIDYDLDIKSYPGLTTKLVDKTEYENHKDKYSYSKRLIRIIDQTALHIMTLINNEDGFFSTDVINQYVRELVATKQISIKIGNDLIGDLL